MDKDSAYDKVRVQIKDFWDEIDFTEHERSHFERVIQNDIRQTAIEDLRTGGYVIEVLESSIWFFLKTESYRESVLSIINLGHDTDTSAAIIGGVAGIYYGVEDIPQGWLDPTARLEDIIDLGNLLHTRWMLS
jgi:ADP-ribosylglycohydrolase